MEQIENSSPQYTETGYIVVKVSTARGAIPLENAAVSIRGNTPETSGIIYSTVTNSDGRTEKIALPAPARELSEAPKNPKPYATYNVDVFSDGYVPISFRGVPVFSSVISIQPAVMVPVSDAENINILPSSPQIYNEYENPYL